MMSALRRSLWWRLALLGLLLAAVIAVWIANLYAAHIWTHLAVDQHRPDDEVLVPVAPSQSPAPMALPIERDREGISPRGAGMGWPTLLGPCRDGSSPETGLQLEWSEQGPPERWRIRVGTGYSSPVVMADNLILFHRQDDREVVECYDPSRGESRWRFSWFATYRCPFNHSSGPYSAPVLMDGLVFALGAMGELCCLRQADGSEVWRRDLYRDYRVKIEVWPASCSPLIEGERLIVNVGGRATEAGVVALDKNSGATLWTATADGASCSTPCAATIHGRRYLFVWTADALVSLDPVDGRVHWRIPFCAKNPEAAHGTPVLVMDDVVFISGYQIGNLCVRVLPDGSYQELWRDKRKALDSQYNNLFHEGGRVWGFSTSRGGLHCLDLSTGELLWRWRSSVRNGSMIAVDGAYLLFGENGRLAVLEIASQGVTVRSMTPRAVLAPPCVSYPALHNGRLFLRNEEELVCIDLRYPLPEKGGL